MKTKTITAEHITDFIMMRLDEEDHDALRENIEIRLSKFGWGFTIKKDRLSDTDTMFIKMSNEGHDYQSEFFDEIEVYYDMGDIIVEVTRNEDLHLEYDIEDLVDILDINSTLDVEYLNY